MNDSIYHLLLYSVVVWPLLLTIPALHSRLPWPCHLAIAPAVLLLVLSSDINLDMPRVLLGSGFILNDEVRWVLTMAIVVWLLGATIIQSWQHKVIIERVMPYFLITLTGNLGVILASDMIGFISFSSLMGYGFYGLLIHKGSNLIRRVGRLYLIFLIMADLILFEALLLAALTTENFQFDMIRQNITTAPSSAFYTWLVLIGFTLKAGIWPAHLWLSTTFKSASPLTTVLLGGIPLAMGLLGLTRWLPLGEQAFPTIGIVMQVMGTLAILYVMIKLTMHRSMVLLPIGVSIILSGIFIMALGTGLGNPDSWRQYSHFSYPYIAILGISLAVITFTISRLRSSDKTPTYSMLQAKILGILTEKKINEIKQQIDNRFNHLLLLRISAFKKLRQVAQTSSWQKPWLPFGEWRIIITMLVLFGLIVAWLAK